MTIPRSRVVTRWLWASIAVVLAACAAPGPPPISMAISSLATPAAAQKRHFFVLPFRGTTVDDLQFQEYGRLAARALTSNGFTQAATPEEADLFVFLSYGIGPPKTETSSISVPTFGQTGVSSATTTGSVSPGGQYQSSTTFTPSFGVIGSETIDSSVTTIRRSAFLLGFDAAAARAKTPIQLWSTTIVSVGSSGDLRYIFPYLMRGATPYLGVDTGRMVTVQIPVDR